MNYTSFNFYNTEIKWQIFETFYKYLLINYQDLVIASEKKTYHISSLKVIEYFFWEKVYQMIEFCELF